MGQVIFFQRFYLDREKDIVVDLYMEGERLLHIIRTPNHHTGNLISNLARLCGLPTGEDENGSMIIPWEYVLLSDGTAPADFNAGAYSLDSTGGMEDNRVTMFQQRYDGSVKPAGQITGGFVENTMEFGEAYIR